MSGLDLRHMSMGDMVDVLHYLFEEDNTYTSEEQMQSKLKMRETVYRELYDVDYRYKLAESKAASFDYDDDPGMQQSSTQGLDDIEYSSDTVTPFRPREQQPTKPYIPPTKFDPDAPKPFGNILDAPLG